MSATKHTPGPWSVREEPHDCFVEGVAYEGHPYFQMCHRVQILSDEDYPTRLADARLIAAAPDLLSALKGIVREIRAYSSPECDDADSLGYAELKAADAAIAKAEGRAA